MARKVKDIQIDGNEETDRDAGKVFRITEMPAMQAEKWGARAFLAMSRSGVDIPQNVVDLGMVGLVYVGLEALTTAHWEDVEPLLDEMMTCVRFVPDPSKPEVVRIPSADGDIEEISTLLRLRKEVFDIHTGFTWTGALSNLSGLRRSTDDTSNTQTSLAS